MNSKEWSLESEGSYIGYCWVAIRWSHYYNDPLSVALAFGKSNGKYYRVSVDDEYAAPGMSITEDDYRAEIMYWRPLEDPPEPPPERQDDE